MMFVILVVAVVAVALLVALLAPTRVAAHTSSHPHSDVDDEAEAWRQHTQGGGTGSV